MVSSGSAVEDTANNGGITPIPKKPLAASEENSQSSLKNGVTDESSQNSVASDKTATNGSANGTNGEHKKDAAETPAPESGDTPAAPPAPPVEEDLDFEIEEFDDVAADDVKDEKMDQDEPEDLAKKEKTSEEKKDGGEEDVEMKEEEDAEKKVKSEKDDEEEDEADENEEENDENRPKIVIVKDVNKLDKGLPQFLRRRVKVGKWTPCEMPKSGEFKMKENEALVEVPSLTVPLLVKEKDVFARRVKDGKVLPPKPRKIAAPSQNQFKLGQTSVVDFFTSSAGEFLMELGYDRVSESYHKDMIKLKEREMRRHGKSTELLESAKTHAEKFQLAKGRNAAFHHDVKRCKTCDFKTESQLVLEGHLLTPHFTQRRELQCSLCPFITRDAKQIIFHMEAHHNKVPTMEPPPQFYECPFCPFETNIKSKAGTHVNRCQRYFNNNVNQSPGNDFQAPGMTSKPITNDDIKMYEKFFIALTQAKTQAAQAAQAASTAQQRQQQQLLLAASQRNQARNNAPTHPQQNATPNMAQNASALYQQLQQTMAAATAANRAAQVAAAARNGRNSAAATSLLQQAQALAQVAGAQGLLNGTNGLSVTALTAQNRAAAVAAAANLSRTPQQQDGASLLSNGLSATTNDSTKAAASTGLHSATSSHGSMLNQKTVTNSPQAVPKDLYVDEYDYKFKFKQFCADGSARWICTNRKCKAAFVIPKGESKPRFPVGPEMHNHKAYKLSDGLPGLPSSTPSASAYPGLNLQALAALTNNGTNTQPLLAALAGAARGDAASIAALGGMNPTTLLAALTAKSGLAGASKDTSGASASTNLLAQMASAAQAQAKSKASSGAGNATNNTDVDGVLPDKGEIVPGMPTRLGTPGSGRAPVILESSGQTGNQAGQGASGAFVICEICDGYIKDLDQLRTHMQWIHKVKIHPKMLASRPPLSCQKCQWRFFTDQGLERHLLGAHGLVTSNMQELANNGQDGGRCTVCGRIYASKLVAHMSQVHRVVLKPAHLSYKCTVCTATFNLYKLFESHVYSVHSGAMKRGPSSNEASATKKRRDAESVSTASASNLSVRSSERHRHDVERKDDYPRTCKLCGDIKVDDWLRHLGEKHMPKAVKVSVCQIDKCGSCLSNFDGMVVMNSDMGESSSSSGSDDEDD